MKILHTSDWHLGRNLESIQRLAEQRQFILELCLLAEKEEVDLVAIAGDIFDTYNPSAKAEELFYEALDLLSNKGKRAIFVIAGNHDNPDRLCAASPLAVKSGIFLMGYPNTDLSQNQPTTPHVRVMSGGPGWLELTIDSSPHSVVIAALPYPSEFRLNEVLTENIEERGLQKAYSQKVGDLLAELAQNFRPDTVNLAISHLFILGGKDSESERTYQVGGALTVSADMMPPNAHYVALGHLHRPQKIKDATSPTYYSGSPLAYSFSESGYSKVVYLVEAAPGETAKVTERFVNSGKSLARWRAANIEEAITWCREGKDKEAWVDLEIITDTVLLTEEQKLLRELHSGIINIRPIIKEQGKGLEALEESREGRSIHQLFKDYYLVKERVEISDEVMNMFFEILDENEEKDLGNEEAAASVLLEGSEGE